MKRNHKQEINRNYLDHIPVRSEHIQWSADEKSAVTIDIENKGLMNRIAQKLFRKPKVSHIYLDELGSFIWLLIDGEKRISDFGAPMEERFGEKANPLYERLAKYFQILESYGFVHWGEDNGK